MRMIIKTTSNMKPQLRQLWSIVFGDNDQYIDVFLNFGFEDGIGFAYVIEGVPVSVAYFLSVSTEMNGRTVKGRYIYAVATLPEYRGKGYAKEILKYGCQYYDEIGESFAVLVPATESLFGFYESVGFQTFAYEKKITLKAEKLPIFKEKVIIENITNGKQFFDLRKKFLGTQSGLIEFSPKECCYILAEANFQGGGLLRTSGISGYALWYPLSKSEVCIKEIACTSCSIEEFIGVLNVNKFSTKQYQLRLSGKVGDTPVGVIRCFGDFSITHGYLLHTLD